MFGREQLTLYFIMGSQDVGSRPEQALQVLAQALQDGITLFQWREKGPVSLQANPQAYEAFARDCLALCRQFGVAFVVNDDVDLAIQLDADGVHIGQDDADVAATRARLGNKILGVSAHSVAEVASAMAAGADYVGLGPIYPTASKNDAQAPTGLTWLRQARAQYPEVAMVAIGGIGLAQVPEVMAAGADGVALISAICQDQSFVKRFHALNG